MHTIGKAKCDICRSLVELGQGRLNTNIWVQVLSHTVPGGMKNLSKLAFKDSFHHESQHTGGIQLDLN